MATRSLTAILLNQAMILAFNKAVPALAGFAWNNIRMLTRSDPDNVVDAGASRTITAVIEVYFTSAHRTNVSAALEKLIEACNNNSPTRSSLLSSCITLAAITACFYIFTRVILTQVCRRVLNPAARCHPKSQKKNPHAVGSTNRSANEKLMPRPTREGNRDCPNKTTTPCIGAAPTITKQATNHEQRAKSAKACSCKWRPTSYNRKQSFLLEACYRKNCKYIHCYERYNFNPHDDA